MDEAAAAPFHLFFPTKIGSGLPFLLHGYFEVNAARTGFYDGSAAQNEAILDELADLVADAVADTAAQTLQRLRPFPISSVSASRPRIRTRRPSTHERSGCSITSRGCHLRQDPPFPSSRNPPSSLSMSRPDLIDRIAKAFPPSYVFARTNRGVPSRDIGVAGHRFLMRRRPEGAPDLWESLASLCRPGKGGPWESGAEDSGFRALLDLVAALDVSDPCEDERPPGRAQR